MWPFPWIFSVLFGLFYWNRNVFLEWCGACGVLVCQPCATVSLTRQTLLASHLSDRSSQIINFSHVIMTSLC